MMVLPYRLAMAKTHKTQHTNRRKTHKTDEQNPQTKTQTVIGHGQHKEPDDVDVEIDLRLQCAAHSETAMRTPEVLPANAA